MLLSNIKKVLNPTITEPSSSFAQQMKVNGQWIAFEVALLGTKTGFGQFVLTVSYTCKFNNAMMSSLRISPASIIRESQLDKSPSFDDVSSQ